ncbi:MAG: SBBP repeat-containing protein [Candidatus Cloacimonadaceae bacterium]
MKKTLLLVLLLLCTTFIFAQSDVWQWVEQAGGIGNDYGRSITIDSSGNSYITGYFYGTASFGSTTLTTTGSGAVDIFVAKLDSSGNWLWAKQAGGNNWDVGFGIATDSSGNSYVTGFFAESASFGSTTLTSSGGEDIFVAKLDSSGNWLWAKQAGGTGLDIGYGIATDSSGNSYVTGFFAESASFGSTTLTSSGGEDIFVAKLDSSGNWLWAKQAGGTSPDYGWGIAIDSSENSYVTGYFEGTASFGTTNLTSSGVQDIFIAKLDSSGNWLWVKQAGGTSDDYGLGISTDSYGNSYITGYFSSAPASFGTINLTSSGYADIFVAKLDSSGNWLWVKQAGGNNWDVGFGIATDSSGNSYITGLFAEFASFGSTTLTSSGQDDIFVAKLDNNGNWLWVKQAGGISSDEGFAITTDSSENSYVTGYYQGTASFGSIELTSSGGNDIFIAKLGAEEPPLPVVLTSFSATISDQNYINLTWITQSETEMLGYYVMRSTQNDLSTAEVISPLIYATNTSQPNTYRYTDEEVTDSGIYYYWLQCYDYDGIFNIYGSVSIDYNLGGGDNPHSIPLVTELLPVYPNPFNILFNSQLFIPFNLSDKSVVKICIYNTRGEMVKEIAVGEMNPGNYRIEWDGRDNNGIICGNGTYYLVMKTGNYNYQRKAVLMK